MKISSVNQTPHLHAGVCARAHTHGPEPEWAKPRPFLTHLGTPTVDTKPSGPAVQPDRKTLLGSPPPPQATLRKAFRKLCHNPELKGEFGRQRCRATMKPLL